MDTDILTHLPGAVQWVEEALSRRAARIEDGQQADNTKKGSVLVHCQAGVSRSSTVVAACLMRAKDLDPVEAVELIRQQRAHVEYVQFWSGMKILTYSPSETFWKQLELYHASNGKVSLKDRSTRKFYMERTTTKFMSESSYYRRGLELMSDGDGSAPPMDKMAKYPATPTLSNPPTPSGGHGRRKIRCKMCRYVYRQSIGAYAYSQAPAGGTRTHDGPHP
jgi:dual specificity phosphatase 12